MFFLVKYCKALEEGSFRSRSADFLWMLVFGAPPLPESCCCRRNPVTRANSCAGASHHTARPLVLRVGSAV